MKVTFLKDHGNNKKGATGVMRTSTARALMVHGVVEEFKASVENKSTK